MSSTAVEIPCCICGIKILPNAANQCSSCLAQQVDMKGILRRGPGGGDLVLYQCRQCRSFERTAGRFQNVEMESPQLMAICLKHIPALNSTTINTKAMTTSGTYTYIKPTIVDSMFVWTEPNSKRIRLRLTVRAEVCNVQIQQRCIVEFIVQWKQCPECNREYTNRQWHAVVQLRQRRDGDGGATKSDKDITAASTINNGPSRKGLAMIEMAIARNAAIRKHVLFVNACKQGFDFYFLGLSEAQQFSNYLARVAPLKIKTTQKLVSTDVKSNTANIKYTVVCDMVPLCRDDLILLHKMAKGGGSMTGRLALVTKVSSVVRWVDASPRRDWTITDSMGELGPETYYKSGAEKMFKVLSSSRRMVRFVVLDIELLSHDRSFGDCGDSRKDDSPIYQGPQNSNGNEKYALADVQVVRESDFGENNEMFQCVTHLGHLLQVGDVVLGYDLSSAVMSGDVEWSMEHKCLNSSFVMPDVVLVKKVQGNQKDLVGPEKELGRAKSGRAKKREKRNRREEKKSRALEEAAGRMGFLDQEPLNPVMDFDEELLQDPEFAQDLVAAERALMDMEDKVVDPSTVHSAVTALHVVDEG